MIETGFFSTIAKAGIKAFSKARSQNGYAANFLFFPKYLRLSLFIVGFFCRRLRLNIMLRSFDQKGSKTKPLRWRVGEPTKRRTYFAG